MVKLKEIPFLYSLKLKISFFKTLFKDIKFVAENKTEFINIFEFLKSRLKIINHTIKVHEFFLDSHFSAADWFLSKTPVFIDKFEKNSKEKNKIKNILEIGSFEGRSTIFFLNYFSNCNITCVDTWSGSHEQGDLKFEIAEYSIKGDKILGNKLYSRLKKISKSEENNQNVRSINLQIKSSTDKKATSKDSAGNILAYRITLITEIKVKDFNNDEKILNQKFNYSLSYDVQDQISETKKRENRSIDDLLDKTYRELLIVLSKNII